MPADFSGYQVAAGETPISSTKQNNLIVAAQNAFNAIGDTSLMGWFAGQILGLSQLKIGAATDGQAIVASGGAWVPGTVSGTSTIKKKTTAKDVTSASKTDLFNSEITIGSADMGANGAIEIFAAGDYLNSSGTSKTFDLELKLGTQVLWDGGSSISFGSNANRAAWQLRAFVQAMGSTTAQAGHGQFMISDRASATTGTGPLGNVTSAFNFLNAATTVNMTSSQTLTFSVTNSATGTSFRLTHAWIRVTG